MTYLLILFLSSFALSLLITPFVIRLTTYWRILDDPQRGHPGILHKRPIPRAGGIPMYIAFAVTGFIAFGPSPLVLSIIIAAGWIVLAGVWDDLFESSPYSRLLFIWPLAILLVIANGLTFYMTNPFGEGLLYFNYWTWHTPFSFFPELIIPAHFIIIGWILWIINTVKLSKGASQLPGIAFFSFLTIAAVSLKYTSGNPEQFMTAGLAMIMAGAVLAFVPFNFPPERMFPGDSAAAFIGFLLGVLSIISGGKLAAAIIVLGIPAIDMTAIVIYRMLQKKNPLTAGGQDHLYHKLLALGFDKRTVILLYWVFTALLGAIAITLDTSREKLFVFAGIGVITVGSFVLLHRWLGRQPTPPL